MTQVAVISDILAVVRGDDDQRVVEPVGRREKFDELVGLLDLPGGGRVLDFATGKAELLRRIVSRWDCTGVGVDLSVPAVEEARKLVTKAGLSEAIEILQGDVARTARDAPGERRNR